MRRNAIMAAAGALAFGACVSASAVRSCSFERNSTGFDARLPLPEGALTVSCTEWISSSTACIAEASALGKDARLDAIGSARHRRAELSIPLAFSGKRLSLEGRMGKGVSARLEPAR